MTFEEAAVQVMTERGETRISIGDVPVWEEIYERKYAGGDGVRSRNPHPMNRQQAVFDALRRSRRFKCVGYIRSIAWSDREHRHPLYRLIVE